ncbi:hypothetical protein IAQ61_011698 [Plenodomus lingam]|uniref:Uncharacterized protein n=1 Tax=Leptosphaeria maculans (strain JN3 / isolate v23.1.3 / race Av1-4-5-6-7-8) TaxID=985895 RepID=E5AAU9_LEPMJ|nr:hypothetical protein LEMA_P019200.1 [Plenodomus lingam JN3]KAH9859915.1 hypothetical protein IAQ61_011698 [Plenodomus lingam]CBY00790.1 hypothetical protein LEMA_P019200.1 [Plenodomus lingam JN3]
MAPNLGKRKRVTRAELEQPSLSPTPSSNSEDSGAEDLQAAFRRAFEAKFKPLPSGPKKPKIEEVLAQEEEEEDGEETDWSGISEGENDVQVIEYTDTKRERDGTERALKKAFMSSKPPTSETAPTKILTGKKNKKEDDDEVGDVANLKNDLALQKLLRESHLLSASSSGNSTPTLVATGITRHKSTDLYLQSLGAKSSVFTQKKMPMAQRKHMIQKARDTEAKRRAEAKEAGIVLEREKKVGNVNKEKKRERSIGGPSIGRFKGGTLTLSKKDVRSITGGGGGAKGKGKKGKR